MQLRELFAGNNLITVLPIGMSRLDQLKLLHVAGNHIGDVDAKLLMPSLEKLYFSCNELTEFPNSLGRFAKLETIDLSGNKIVRTDVTAVFVALHELILSHNGMQKFSFACGAMCSFPRLVLLDLSNNALTVMPEVSDLSELEILNLLHCNITVMSRKLLDQHSKLSIIYMQGNPVEKARDLRVSFVERKTDLLITDLFKGPNNTVQLVNRLKNSATERQADVPEILFSWSEVKGARTTQEDAMTLRQDLGSMSGTDVSQL
jgi:Leucine-rich repeat (LRR) protein